MSSSMFSPSSVPMLSGAGLALLVSKLSPIFMTAGMGWEVRSPVPWLDLMSSFNYISEVRGPSFLPYLPCCSAETFGTPTLRSWLISEDVNVADGYWSSKSLSCLLRFAVASSPLDDSKEVGYLILLLPRRCRLESRSLSYGLNLFLCDV